ncbi:hypothetical protein RBB50_011517 [Rhinocladiella similis]
MTCNILDDIHAALGVFQAYANEMPFSHAAGQKITTFREKMCGKPGSENPVSSAAAVSEDALNAHVAFDLPELDFNLDLPTEFASPGPGLGPSMESLGTLSSLDPQWEFDEDLIVLPPDSAF